MDENPAMGVIQGRDFLHPELDLFIKFPKEWKSINSRQALFAVAPKKDGLLVMAASMFLQTKKPLATRFLPMSRKEISSPPPAGN